jgi:hypothetical protein
VDLSLAVVLFGLALGTVAAPMTTRAGKISSLAASLTFHEGVSKPLAKPLRAIGQHRAPGAMPGVQTQRQMAN